MDLHGKIYGFRLRFSLPKTNPLTKWSSLKMGWWMMIRFLCILLPNTEFTAWWYRSFWFFAPSPSMWWHKMIDMPKKHNRMSRFDCRIKDIGHIQKSSFSWWFCGSRHHIFGENCCAMLCRAGCTSGSFWLTGLWGRRSAAGQHLLSSFWPFGKPFWLVVDLPLRHVSQSMGRMTSQPIDEMENNPAMFQTINQHYPLVN